MKRTALAIALLTLIAVGAYTIFKPTPDYSDAPNYFLAERLTPNGLERVRITANAKPYLVIYHTALWCPPGERFSPILAEFYKNADKAKFQLVIMDYDNSEEEIVAYLHKYKMDCAIIPRGWAADWGTPPTEIGIPNLVIVDTATRKVLDQAYHHGFVGPNAPLETLKKLIRQ